MHERTLPPDETQDANSLCLTYAMGTILSLQVGIEDRISNFGIIIVAFVSYLYLTEQISLFDGVDRF